MKRSQWITAAVALLSVIGLYAATQNQIFGTNVNTHEGHDHSVSAPVLTTDSILAQAKATLPPEQANRLSFLENSISRGNVQEQQLHVYHQLSRFWGDTARMFEPYAWYTAESARLENSENSLTFAAHLFLNNLRGEENPQLKQWKALQAKDLFERSLKVNPANDSSEVGLGSVYIYGGISDNPMEGLQRILKVAREHPENVYAQMTLGHASVVSGQLDKAIERFQNVLQQQPGNLEALLSLADTYERKRDNENAIVWYQKSLPYIQIPAIKAEVEQRIADLSKK